MRSPNTFITRQIFFPTKICSLLSSSFSISTSCNQTRTTATINQTPTTRSGSGYQYTMDNSGTILNNEQKDFYEQNGYIVIKNVVNQKDLDKYL